MSRKRTYVGGASLGIFYFNWPFMSAWVDGDDLHVSLALGIIEHVVPLRGQSVKILPSFGPAIFSFQGGTLGKRRMEIQVLRGASEFEAELRAAGADLHV